MQDCNPVSLLTFIPSVEFKLGFPMILRHILREKGSLVHTIAPHATLTDACRRLVEYNCGSLVVCERDRMVGIISERDLMRAMAADPRALDTTLVESRMTTKVIVATPDDEMELIMGRMTQNRIRHLPILENGNLVGIVSIGDIVKAHHDRLCMENEYLKHYIHS